jgi:hypothetical protein
MRECEERLKKGKDRGRKTKDARQEKNSDWVNGE